jgi:hypothetical protein
MNGDGNKALGGPSASPHAAGTRRRAVAVLMERRVIAHRWASDAWAPVAVYDDDDAPAAAAVVRRIDDPLRELWLHTGLEVTLHRDEAEGYYLNLTTAAPYAFVEWESTERGGVPRAVTLSYNEAARRMDGAAQVDGVPMPAPWLPWVAQFTQDHYQPEASKKRIRPPSFKGARRDDGDPA